MRESPRVRSDSEVRVRAQEPADLPAAVAVSAAAFEVDVTDEPTRRRWYERMAYLPGTDPDGCFVAEDDGRVVGVAHAMRRGHLWSLSLLAVDPGVQSRGAGRALMQRALGYRRDCDAGLIVSSNDPRALRLYALSGFCLQPTFQAAGTLDRSALPASHPAVREGDAADLEALAPISRKVRGAPHTDVLAFALGRGARLLRLGDRGFAVAQPGQGVWLLAAHDEEAATALLWSALELGGDADRPSVRWITGGQDWAIEVVLRAGLRLSAYGALCVRGRPGPLRPFVPSAPFV